MMISGLRFGGLASGIDTEALMKDIMRAYQTPVDRLKQNKQVLEWQREQYREINTSLRSFRDLVFDMRLQGTYSTKKTSSSNENILAASANVNAVEGTYTMQVEQLARTAFLTGGQLDTGGAGGGVKLETLAGSGPALDQQTLEIAVNGEVLFSQQIDPSSMSVRELVSLINTGQENSKYQVKASYDENTQRMILMTAGSGAEQQLSVTSSGGTSANNALTDALKITVEGGALGTNIAGSGAAYQAGQDAKFTLNGAALTSATNKFTMYDITFDLKNAEPGRDVFVTVSRDTDAVFDAVVKFVDEYNKLVDSISDKLYEEKFKDYKPLTDEQREQLSDEQIKKWEEKAQSGLLTRDPLLSGIYSQLGFSMSGVVDVGGGYERNGQTVLSNMLSSIGISTTKDYMSNRLEINPDKLREAIEKDPTGVMDLFTKQADERSQMGIAARLYEDVNDAMGKIALQAGHESNLKVDESSIGEALKQINKNIELQEQRVKMVEERYWKQFTAMERAIQQLNSQSAWLAQQFGTGGQG